MEPVYVNKVCYIGDYGVESAAVYLCGIMTHYGIAYDQISSFDRIPQDFKTRCYSLYIISDYPRSGFNDGDLEHIARCVREEGSGLLMLGGWESYHGQNGEYNNTALVDVLPVTMLNEDDRRCSAVGILLTDNDVNHPIIDGLPWAWPPMIVGYNEFVPKKGAEVLLNGFSYEIRILNDNIEEVIPEASYDPGKFFAERVTIPTITGDSVALRPLERIPMLVVGTCGKGRVTAFASDVAPHWVGGLVDWGKERVYQEVGSGSMEVGSDYAMFFRNMVKWTGKIV